MLNLYAIGSVHIVLLRLVVFHVSMKVTFDVSLQYSVVATKYEKLQHVTSYKSQMLNILTYATLKIIKC